MVDWSELPDDVGRLIGRKLWVVGDQVRFRSVCWAWRSLLPPPRSPWLMRQRSRQDDEDDCITTPNTLLARFSCGFFHQKKRKAKTPTSDDEDSSSTCQFFALGLDPDDGDQVVVQQQFEFPDVQCVGSLGTWLITADMSLLNPFSMRKIDLSFPPYPRQGLWKLIISSCPLSSDSGNCCTAMMIDNHYHALAFARPGDPSWTRIQSRGRCSNFQDIIFCKNQFYGITMEGILVMVGNIDDDPLNLQLIQLSDCITPCSTKYRLREVHYLVEWMGELVVVIKYLVYIVDYKCDRFEVYLYDFVSGKCKELKNLEGYSLFLGRGSSVAILVSHCLGIKKNCIYFTDDFKYAYRACLVTHDMGVFDMENGSIKLHFQGKNDLFFLPPLWIIPPSAQSITKNDSSELDTEKV